MPVLFAITQYYFPPDEKNKTVMVSLHFKFSKDQQIIVECFFGEISKEPLLPSS